MLENKRTEGIGKNDSTYYFENDLRKVKPYIFHFKVYAKGRWIKKTLINMLIDEFQGNDENYYVCVPMIS